MANLTGLKQMIYAERYGQLYWHKFVGGADGRKLWAPGFGTLVGEGFNVYKPLFVFSGGFGGIIYGIKPNGELYWHQHAGAEDGTPQWGGPGVRGSAIGSGWNAYKLVFAIWNVIYGVTPSGALHWHRHDGCLDGSATWAEGSGRQIGTGWNFKRMFASGSPDAALLYGCTEDGDLYCYPHKEWAEGGPAYVLNNKQFPGPAKKKVGNGWNVHRIVFSQSPGEFPGIIYGVTGMGDLKWYRHDGWVDGSAMWTASGGRIIESGSGGGHFGSFNTAFAGHHRLYAPGEEGPVLPPVKEDIEVKRRRPFPP